MWSDLSSSMVRGGPASRSMSPRQLRLSPWPPRCTGDCRSPGVVLATEPPGPPLRGSSSSLRAWTCFKLLSEFGYPSDRARRNKRRFRWLPHDLLPDRATATERSPLSLLPSLSRVQVTGISSAHHEEVGEHPAGPTAVAGSSAPTIRGRCRQAPHEVVL